MRARRDWRAIWEPSPTRIRKRCQRFNAAFVIVQNWFEELKALMPAKQ
jgi:hypothetical protein